MSDVLVVPAGELSDPMPFVVDVVADNRLLHFETSHSGTIGLVELTSFLIVTAAKAASVAA